LQLAKLERMQQYAEATFCRRQILLQYFGETKKEPCNYCDVCRNPPATFDGTLLAQKALSAISRLKEQAKLGVLIDVLRGSRNQAIVSKGYDKIKTFGAGADLGFLEWQTYLQQMLNAGIFDIAYDEAYALKLNPKSERVLFQAEKVPLVKFQPITTAAPAEKTVRVKPKKELLKDELFDRLRKLRKQLADQHNVPPYVVFSDNTLLEMAAEKPTNRVAMLAISGVGMVKYENYGYDFENEITRFISEQQEQGNKVKGATHLVTLELLNQGLSPDEIARERNLNPVTIYSHVATLYEQGYEINIKKYLSQEDYNAIKIALKSLPPEAKLKEIFDFLQEAYDYFKIRLAIAVFNREFRR
jgi:ATP-dependent DNA helicase RecQ